MLTGLKINGFKCFDELDITLKNLTLLTGVNSSGKSSVIQAILLLLQQAEQTGSPLNGKFVRLGLMQDIKNSITNPKVISIQIKGSDDSQRERICALELDMEDKNIIVGREVIQSLDLVYLSAERIGVEDVYKQNLTNEYRIGIHGEYAFDYLSQERMNELGEPDFMVSGEGVNLGNQVDYWLNYIFGYSITAERIAGTAVVKVSYRSNGSGSKEIKPYHIGTGISYVASVIIAALSCKKGSFFIIENPEIHLHPGAQAKLLDFFCFLSARGLQVLIETHSDHIFNGVRKSVKAGNISRDKIGIYFFKQTEAYLSKAVEIYISEDGGIQNHVKGLFDQFDDDLDELLGL